jgi:type I restriction enzyme S subunit
VREDTEGIPSLGGENILTDGGITYEVLKRVPRHFFRLMPKGHLQTGQTGKAGIYDGAFVEASVNEHLFILRSTNGSVDQRLLYYYLLLPETQAEIAKRITGSAQPGLNSQFVDAVRITIPTAQPEQRGIAEILSTVDQAIAHTEALIAKMQQIKAGLMHDLFTRGITSDGQLRPLREDAPKLYKESPVGWIPGDWHVATLARLCQADITYGIVQAGPHVEDGVPYVRTGDMWGDRLVREELLCTSRDIAAAYRRSEVRAGEIVCAIRATVGKVLPVPPELDGANLTQGTARIAPNAQTDPTFLLWRMRTADAQAAFRAQVKGTTFSEITLVSLRQLKVAIPLDKEEQQRIASRLEANAARVAAEQSYLGKLRNLKAGLMHDLLTGRVRVPDAETEKVAANV